MKLNRFLCALALSIMLVSLSGCYNANWTFSFIGIEDTDLSTFYAIEYGSAPSRTPTIRGLRLEDTVLLMPVSAADMKVTLKFDLEVDEFHTVDMSLGIASDRTSEPIDTIVFAGKFLGNAEEYIFWANEAGDLGYDNRLANTARLNMNGSNIMELVKKGNIYTGRLNGSLIYRINAIYCEADAFIPAIFSRSDGGNIYFTSITMDYTL